MKLVATISLFIFTLLSEIAEAQSLSNKILITVNNTKTEAGEFIRMYKKNQEGKKPDIDEYLNLFISFRLKVADAINEGFDTTEAFKNELKGYRDQLAQSYLTDTKSKEEILQKAYQRYLTEISAWHILISCAPDASPEDTLYAWTKATDIRTRIIGGESFEQVARSSSDDKSVMTNGGNLGYFSAFQMIMPFEEAAYNLKKGVLSDPIRTPYGYHLIMVTDRRPSKGKIEVAHIMKATQPVNGDKESLNAETEIRKIYNELQNGASFSELAKKYSDHKESAVNGGKINWFSSGEMIPDFSEAAFSIKDTGQYTKPFKTLYGWHIVKLLNRQPPGSFDETRSFLESRINQSNLSSICKKSFVEKLKKEYKFKLNNSVYDWFVKNTDTLIIRGLSKYRRDSIPSESLYTFANQSFTARDFLSFVEKKRAMSPAESPSLFISRNLETRISDHIISYENSILEKKYPEFRYLVNEFHDGILIFDISGKKVWNKVNDDSTGLRNYYEQHKKEYLSPRRIEAKIYSLKLPGNEANFISAYKKHSHKQNIDKILDKKFNKERDSLLVIKEGTWFEGEDQQLDKLNWVPGTFFNKTERDYIVVVLKKVLEPEPLSFNEVKGEMMNGFQDELDNEWIRQLKQKYTVKIDNQVLLEVKKKLNDE